MSFARGYRKRPSPNMLAKTFADSVAEATETQVWIDLARDCGYLNPERHDQLADGFEQVGKTLGCIIAHPERFAPRHDSE
jgi:four helix bundle protein